MNDLVAPQGPGQVREEGRRPARRPAARVHGTHRAPARTGARRNAAGRLEPADGHGYRPLDVSVAAQAIPPTARVRLRPTGSTPAYAMDVTAVADEGR
ncbi:hypothetical protein [Streptomyces sp. UNOB3_S3]|uniref:hypothetical protein n=1 Tax=Streptomyces sp. UNOB3_S3 TaxID=2871682 RepID=UPI001E3CA936|nr:hypothetical protein [Streptomyces sp. UNOB3_S3]MCC3774388.1 hypothetical protein [Streptomyces sp. UNOB3_S3]